jgi:transcriptional regulator with XRE-family HTH domain
MCCSRATLARAVVISEGKRRKRSLSERQLARYEAGEQEPTVGVAIALAHILACGVEEIFAGDPREVCACGVRPREALF